MGFAAVNGLDPFLQAPATAAIAVLKLFMYFAAYLRMTRFTSPGVPIKGCTIDQYISHVVDHLTTHEYVDGGHACRSRRLALQLAGYTVADNEGKTKRLMQKIPLTYPLVVLLRIKAATVYKGAALLAMNAALALAYGLSLRPGEYSVTGKQIPLHKQVNATNCFFIFKGDVCVNVCDPHLYPPDEEPLSFLCSIDKVKNQRTGEGGPRAVSAAPSPTPEFFCCVRELFLYFRAFPGRRESLALASHGPAIRQSDIRELCRSVAVDLGVDPARLLPHSFRFGVLAQIELEADERKEQQGGWLSKAGMRVYVTKAWAHANAIRHLVHDHSLCPLTHTLMIFSDHSEATIYAPSDVAAGMDGSYTGYSDM